MQAPYLPGFPTRRAYLASLLRHSASWIEGSMRNPSASMLRHPSTIALRQMRAYR